MRIDPWVLFLDDERQISDVQLPADMSVFLARSVAQATAYVEEFGAPNFMSLDHDLGGDETAMQFVHWLLEQYELDPKEFPQYQVHSQNPVGKANLIALVESWKRVFC
jgi:hypothetical protein